MRELADSFNYSKRVVGHSYISSMVDVTEVCTTFKDVSMDAFVIRAAAKAYQATIASSSDESLSVSRVFGHNDRVTYTDVQNLRVAQISKSGCENGPLPAGTPAIQVL